MREQSINRSSSTASDQVHIGDDPSVNPNIGRLFSLFRRQRSRDISFNSDRKIEGNVGKLSDNNQAAIAERSVAVECESRSLDGSSDRSSKSDETVNVGRFKSTDITDIMIDNNTAGNIVGEEGGKQHEDNEGSDCKSEVRFDSTKRFNWFGAMQPKRRDSSCNEDDLCPQEPSTDKQVFHMNRNMVEEKEKQDGRRSEGESSDEAEEKILHDSEDDTQCVTNSYIMTKGDDECEFLIKTKSRLADETFALWQRRQRLKRKLQIDGPVFARERSHESMKMLGVSQMEVGGGRNEENLRSLELEADLIDNHSDRKMRKMEIMSTEEKEREDLLYDMWLDDCLLMAGEEPYDGYDHLGWYSTLTQREDGEADLECMDSYVMDVETENDASDKKSNPWLDGIGNAALFIFAPDLYLIQRMDESSFQPQYHVTSTIEDGENENPPKGWFRKILTKEGRGKKTKESVILAS